MITILLLSSLSVKPVVGRGDVAVRTSGSQPGFEYSCCRFEALAISFIPRCHSSLSCINNYLAIGSNGCLNVLAH